MRKNRLFILVLMLAIACLAGCGGSGGTAGFSGGSAGTAAVSVSITDTPPAGISVLAFEATITAATLHPGNVDLLAGKGPIKIEIKRLETEAAFLNTANVPPGTYSSLTLGFANPELTFKNDTNPPITILGCNPGQVCEIKPSVAANIDFAGPPFPLTVSASTPAGLLVDVNLNNILTSTLSVDFTVPSGVTITQLPLPAQLTGELEDIEDLTGKVANKGTDTFDLQLAQRTITGIKVDSTTELDDFSCNPISFTNCVQNGQVVEVDLRLLAAGGFLAKKIELEDSVADDELEGVVFSVDSPTQFRMVVHEELSNLAGVDVGNPITVNLATGTSLRVDTDGLTIPASLQSIFEGATDTSQLAPGQEVQVRVRSLTAGPPITVSTDRVRLRMSSFTATVAGGTFGSNFNVTNLPSLFVVAGITQIQVQTSSNTKFEGVSGIGGLADGNTVSLRGLLFKGTPNVLVASKVRKR